jgi:general secretion pathway protein C
MLDTIAQRWRLKLTVSAPLLASSVLALLVGGELVRDAWLVLPLYREDTETSGETTSLPSPEPRAKATEIVAAHLFGVLGETDPNAKDTDAEPTAAQLVLSGTLASKDPKKGMAIVKTGDGRSQLYRVGADLDGAIVRSVYADRIVLDRKGQLEFLTLPRTPSMAGQPAPQPTEVASAQRQDGPELAAVMRAGGAEANADGRIRGFHIYPGRDRDTFLSSGLHGGDLVVAVNGASVQDQNRQNTQELFKTIGNSARATLTIERFGQTREVTIDLAQAGTSPQPDPARRFGPATSVD